MLDSFFGKGFKAAKCKTLLKVTIPRIKLLRNRRENQLRKMRQEVAKLLETGQEAVARTRVEHILREEKTMVAHEIVELFCELIAARIPIIEARRECPADLKEAISSLCFAAVRCPDLPELLQVRLLFTVKYGKEFVSAATELIPQCSVNRQLVELLSIQALEIDVKLKTLKEIAKEHGLLWEPRASKSAFPKPQGDLPNGYKQPLPLEDHDWTKLAASKPSPLEYSYSDEYFDATDFPEAPDQMVCSEPGDSMQKKSSMKENSSLKNNHMDLSYVFPSAEGSRISSSSSSQYCSASNQRACQEKER